MISWCFLSRNPSQYCLIPSLHKAKVEGISWGIFFQKVIYKEKEQLNAISCFYWFDWTEYLGRFWLLVRQAVTCFDTTLGCLKWHLVSQGAILDFASVNDLIIFCQSTFPHFQIASITQTNWWPLFLLSLLLQPVSVWSRLRTEAATGMPAVWAVAQVPQVLLLDLVSI